MLSFFQKIKFTWSYFVLGRHRLHPERLVPRPLAPPKLDRHTDPLVGDYVRTENETWWSDTTIKGLDYQVTLSAVGSQPTENQIIAFERMIQTLPNLMASSELDEAPEDDGWGNKPPSFNFGDAQLDVITLFENGSFGLDYKFKNDTPYLLSPLVTVSADLSSLSTEWSV